MIKPWATPAWILLSLAGGCAPEPFTRGPLPPLNDPNPLAVRESFLHALRDRPVTFDETVIIQAPFHEKLAALGELVVDRHADRFELVGLTLVGVTLFKIRGDEHGSTVDFAVPQLMEHQNLLLAMGQDIRRMYFDLVPIETAQVKIKKTRVVFSQNTKDGKLVFEFGGEPAVLLDKHLEGVFGAKWRARYYLYASSAPVLYPYGIVMDNNQFHYRIIVKNRAMR